VSAAWPEWRVMAQSESWNIRCWWWCLSLSIALRIGQSGWS
jgi:hypothetical protein